MQPNPTALPACPNRPPAHPLAAPQVRVLQCVSVAVELMGDRVRPHLATITTALPQVGGQGVG